MTIDDVWIRIIEHEGETFYLLQGKAFTYEVVGNAIVPSTTPRNIGRSNFEQALALMPLHGPAEIQHLQGPSYVYAIRNR